MTKPYTPIAIQPYALSDTPGSTPDLVAKTWAAFPPSEADRNHVPVLPNAGMMRQRANISSLWSGSLDGPDGGVVTVEPSPPWGKAATPFTLPKGALVGGEDFDFPNTPMYTQLAADATFTAKLSAAGVVLGRAVAGINDASNLYLRTDVYPVNSGNPASWWNGASGVAGTPQTTWDGGDLILVQNLYGTLVLNYWDINASVFRPFWATDVAALAAAAAKYRTFRLRYYVTSNDSLLNTLCTNMQTDLQAAGIDAAFLGPSTGAGYAAVFEGLIQTFFGIP
jgi:hypothetical protein